MELNPKELLTRSPSRTLRLLNLGGLLSSPVEAESTLEKDFARRGVLFPLIKTMVSQPFVLSVSPGGYTPDFAVSTITNRRYVVEVKLARKVKEYAPLFDRAAEFLAGHGYTFLVATEKGLRKERTHLRAMRIIRYAKAKYRPALCDHVVAAVAAKSGGVTIGTLLKKESITRELIFHLIARKRLSIGPRLMLDDSTLVFIPNLVETDDEDHFARWLDATPWSKDL